jgi:hypothetical protein
MNNNTKYKSRPVRTGLSVEVILYKFTFQWYNNKCNLTHLSNFQELKHMTALRISQSHGHNQGLGNISGGLSHQKLDHSDYDSEMQQHVNVNSNSQHRKPSAIKKDYVVSGSVNNPSNIYSRATPARLTSLHNSPGHGPQASVGEQIATMPHGLSVQELKQLTRMRLARESTGIANINNSFAELDRVETLPSHHLQQQQQVLRVPHPNAPNQGRHYTSNTSSPDSDSTEEQSVLGSYPSQQFNRMGQVRGPVSNTPSMGIGVSPASYGPKDKLLNELQPRNSMQYDHGANEQLSITAKKNTISGPVFTSSLHSQSHTELPQHHSSMAPPSNLLYGSRLSSAPLDVGFADLHAPSPSGAGYNMLDTNLTTDNYRTYPPKTHSGLGGNPQSVPVAAPNGFRGKSQEIGGLYSTAPSTSSGYHPLSHMGSSDKDIMYSTVGGSGSLRKVVRDTILNIAMLQC